MKVTRKDFVIWKNDIYIIPTFRMVINDHIYTNRNFSIEFHWIVFHARLLWVEERKDA